MILLDVKIMKSDAILECKMTPVSRQGNDNLHLL